ncbi:hypothetical protein [uncultured Desulfobulbus sp.]|uniref:hypothetical protein n=1 Tax=uncultured Desulfobulbus sp. TaxID=239745 RepID=UPI0029C7D7C7|nr:hypothetical protein [uncultured Desulfobulbus sp.]
MLSNTNEPKNNRNTKSKLFKLKEWLTVPDAARHLSIVFGEEVTEADVLRFALDGHLKLSVNFVNYTSAMFGKCVAWNSIFDKEWLHHKSLGEDVDVELSHEIINSFLTALPDVFSHRGYVLLDGEVLSIEGVWDLPMIGIERDEIENKYQILTNGPEVKKGLRVNNGVFVERENGEICQLQTGFDENEFHSGSAAELEKINKYIAKNNIEEEKTQELLSQHKIDRKEYLDSRKKKKYSDNFSRTFNLPQDSVLVVRTQALINLQEKLSLEEPSKKKPQGPRAERTYLNIIGAMLEVLKGDHGKGKFTTETDLKDYLTQKYAGFSGISERTLSEKFALAKKSISEELD